MFSFGIWRLYLMVSVFCNILFWRYILSKLLQIFWHLMKNFVGRSLSSELKMFCLSAILHLWQSQPKLRYSKLCLSAIISLHLYQVPRNILISWFTKFYQLIAWISEEIQRFLWNWLVRIYISLRAFLMALIKWMVKILIDRLKFFGTFYWHHCIVW